MKNRALAGITILAFSMVLAHYGAKPLLAQIRAALVMNVDEPGRSPYQSSITCPFSFIQTCTAALTPVPAGKRLVVQHVSVLRTCFTTPCTGSFLVAGAQDHNLVSGPAAYVPSPTLTNTYTAIDRDTPLYIDAGEIPTIEMSFSGGESSASVTVTGYVVDLNP